MQSFILDTAGIRPAERHDWWATQMGETYGFSSQLTDGNREAFHGRMDVFAAESVSHMKFDIHGHLVERLRPQIRRVEWGSYVVYREHSPGAWFEIAGRECRTGPGDIVIGDADGGMRTRPTAGYRHDVWMVPKALLDPHMPVLPRPMMIHMRAASGITDLVIGYVDALSRLLTTLSEAEIAAAADHLGRLIAIGCGGAARAHGDAIRAARREQVQRFVERNLALPELSAEYAARALRMPVRELHALFGEGESFSRLVRHRRLEWCRAAIERGSGRSITDIAFDGGFGSLPTFYRAFADAYGAAPRELRNRSLLA